MKLTDAQKAELRAAHRARVARWTALGRCPRCRGLEPLKVSERTGRPLKSGAACIAKEAGRIQGRRAAEKVRA